MGFTILIVDDEIDQCASLAEILEEEGYSALYTDKPVETVSLLERHEIDLVILDIRMPDIGGIDLLKRVRAHSPNIDVIILTGYPSIETAVLSMKFGAVDFYEKPPDLDKLLDEVRQFSSRGRLKCAHRMPGEIVTGAREMQSVIRAAGKAAATDAPVLITGESGTGKELIAEHVHKSSDRAKQPFVKVNCAAIPDSLLESELFGHEKGAFTNALSQHKGRFELADRGTIFLDEIGDMSLGAQAKILRVIQEQTFERVGGTETIRTDLRFVAATNKDLVALIAEGDFREDLYYRLCVISLHLPTLRDRAGDVDVLVDHFIKVFNKKYSKSIVGLEEETRKIFNTHSWPGNVRELKNCVERAVIFCDGERLSMADLPSQYQSLERGFLGDHLESGIQELNRKMILEALEKCKGKKGRAADMLNITRRTLYNRMRKLGIQ